VLVAHPGTGLAGSEALGGGRSSSAPIRGRRGGPSCARSTEPRGEQVRPHTLSLRPFRADRMLVRQGHLGS
jgi:hypothetical protein